MKYLTRALASTATAALSGEESSKLGEKKENNIKFKDFLTREVAIASNLFFLFKGLDDDVVREPQTNPADDCS